MVLVLNNNIQYTLQTHDLFGRGAVDSRGAGKSFIWSYTETQESFIIRQESVVSLSSTEGCPALTKHFI